MIVNNEHTKAQTNFVGQSNKFGIADMSIVIELLTKLYSNPRRTLTQEYISNARDANREVGSTTPIKIVAPGKFNSVMIIRDYGPGLTPERIENVFLYYGASTKNSDNTQTGGFGIGAKSAWAYTDSFTITSFVDGVKRSYVAHKSSGNGNLDKVFEGPTDEPNGTEIQIPVKKSDIHVFKAAILRTTYFWEENEKPTLVGFDDVEIKTLETFKLNDKVFLLNNGVPDFILSDSVSFNPHIYGNNNFVVIDGIPYRLLGTLANAALKLGQKVKPQFYIKLNTGDLKIAPTREDIIDNDGNIKKIEDICKESIKDVEYYVSEDLKKYDGTTEKIRRFVELFKTFHIDCKCGDFSISAGRNLIHDSFNKIGLVTLIRNYNKKIQKNESSRIDISHMNNLYFYDRNTKESAAKRDIRFNRLYDAINTDRYSWKEIYVLISPPTKAKKGDDLDRYITKEDFDKIKSELNAIDIIAHVDMSDFVEPVKAPKAPPKKTFCFHAFNGDITQSEYIDLSTKDLIVYNSTDDNEYKRRGNYEFRKLIVYLNNIKVKYGFLAPGSVKKIEKLPNFVKLEDWINSHVPSEDIIKKTLMAQNASSYRRFTFLASESSNILDEDLKEILDNFKISGKMDIEVPDKFLTKVKESQFYKKYEKYLVDSHKVCMGFYKKYPLLAAIPEYAMNNDNKALKEMVRYLNMVYKESNSGS